MSNIWRTVLLSGFVIAGTTASSAWAAESHSLSDIATTAALEMQRRAGAQGYDNVEVSVRPLDGRLTLAACEHPLEILPDMTNRALGPVTVGLRCNGAEPWTLYVRGQVAAEVALPVMAGSVARGELVSSTDITLQSRRITSDFVGIITDIDDIVGKEARRNLASGSELRFSDLKAPVIVDRGQQVSIVSGIAGLRVSMQGKALNSGGVGDRVLVANEKTGKRLEGVVSADGSVMVN